MSAPVVPVGVRSGSLEIPANPDVLGWWMHGAAPGSPVGTSVISGHVDTAADGPGALFRLEKVAMGSEVVVTTARSAIRYRVVARRAYDKRSLPMDLFSTGGTPRLVLITCGGPFDATTRHYRDNIVVYAVPE